MAQTDPYAGIAGPEDAPAPIEVRASPHPDVHGHAAFVPVEPTSLSPDLPPLPASVADDYSHPHPAVHDYGSIASDEPDAAPDAYVAPALPAEVIAGEKDGIAPPPPPVSRMVDASHKEGYFAGEAPKEPTVKFTPEQEAAFHAYVLEPGGHTPDEIRQWGMDHGGMIIGNADKISNGLKIKGARLNSNFKYELPTPPPVVTSDSGLVQRPEDRAAYGGVADAVSLGGAEKLYAGLSAGSDWIGGKTPNGLSDAYHRYLDENNGRVAQDDTDHPYYRIGGMLLGGLAINPELAPVALKAGMTALRAGRTMAEARQVAARAIVLQQAKIGAVQGAGYGILSSDNIPDAIGKGMIGFGTGAVAGAALTAGGMAAAKYGGRALDGLANGPVGAFATRIAPVTPALDPAALRAVQGAADLGIAMPKFALSDAGRAAAGAAEQTPFGRGPIVAGKQALTETATAARDKIATDVGTPIENDADFGKAARTAAVNQMKGNRKAIGDVYNQAHAASDNIPIPATNTISTLTGLVSKENEAIGGTKIGSVLQSTLDNLVKDKGGNITIDGARLTRTALRDSLTNDAGVTSSNADRLVGKVMDAINSDVTDGLKNAGKVAAVNLYHTADRRWSAQIDTENKVLRKILGPQMENTGEDIATKLNSEISRNGTRLARFLNYLPEDEANNLRATFLQRLGKAGAGSQNDLGDRTSLSVMLTNYNKLKGAKSLVFSPDTDAALQKLASVANVAKDAEALKNHPNTGGVISRIVQSSGKSGILVFGATGHYGAAGTIMLAGVMNALKDSVSARLLANPNFARKIVSTPNTIQGAASYWSRPWVQTMAAKSPAIANEIAQFQSGLHRAVNDNMATTHMAAASGGGITPTATSGGPIQQNSNQGHGRHPARQ